MATQTQHLSATPLGSASSAGEAPRPSSRRPFLILGGLLLAVVGVVGGYLLITAGRQNTDDAQVTADLVPVGARVAGQVVKVFVTENQRVAKGDPLVQIDEADFAARVRQAEAEVAIAQAQSDAADAQMPVVEATSRGGLRSAQAAYTGSSVGIASADAQVAAAKAALVRAETDVRKATTDLGRAQELERAHAVPQERVDNTQATYDLAMAQLAQARAQLTAADESRHAAQARVSEAQGRLTQSTPISSQMAIARANADLAHGRVRSATAALKLATLQRAYTQIVAPEAGLASKLSVHPGQWVSVGVPVVELVPTATYVLANFKETQVARMKPDQRARITLDAYPGQHFEGRVESLSGGTGSIFSMLPADNASGNFVKVAQRVPVRIAWVTPPTVPLRAGLSADVTVYVDN